MGHWYLINHLRFILPFSLLLSSVFLWRPTHYTKPKSRLKWDDNVLLPNSDSSSCSQYFEKLNQSAPGYPSCRIVQLVPFTHDTGFHNRFHRTRRDTSSDVGKNYTVPTPMTNSSLGLEQTTKAKDHLPYDSAADDDGILIYQFRLFDSPIKVRLVPDVVPSNSRRQTFFRNLNDKVEGGGSLKRSSSSSSPDNILVQYYSHNSTIPVREEEIFVRRDVRCIYDGYLDPDDLSILLFHQDDDEDLGGSDKVGSQGDSAKGDSQQRIYKNAIFNLCGTGLMGMFQMNGEQYFIEPLPNLTIPDHNRNGSMQEEGSINLDKDDSSTHDPSKKSGQFENIEKLSLPQPLDLDDIKLQPHMVYSISSLKTSPINKLNDYLNDHTPGDDNFDKLIEISDFTNPNLVPLLSDYHQYDVPGNLSEYTFQNFSGDVGVDIYNNATNNTLEENAQKMRKKRSVSREHFIEIMMVADYEVAKAHGPDLQRYILTIMSIVEMIYKNPSIGNSINIVLVKIAIFQDSEYSPKITENGKTTLDNFCKWQHEHNTKSHFERYHHDTAVLLTRQDICSNEINCQALAITNGWICDPTSSCSIAEDNGLSVALTIAHELGHNLGLPHDGDALCKEFKSQDEDLEKYHIMSEVLNPTTRSLSWSDCSHHYLTAFLDKGHGQCLLNKPENLEYMAQMKALRHPGEEYSVHQQCQLIFGPFSHYCPNKLPPCQLYCLNKDHRCQADFIPWADGTPCGNHRWCQSGKCIDKTYHLNPIDGGWSPWTDYTPCSRSCGGGVMTATRTCTYPIPSNNGKYCLGRRTRVKSCNTQECLYKSDFRDEQCAKLNGNNMGIVGIPRDVKWRAAYDIPSSDKCKLYCYASDSTAYKLSNKVIDGTPCDPESTQICIQGICRPVGCDQMLGSKAKFDKCGVCSGDNSTCRTVIGTYNQINYGYNNVGRIPRGATNVDIRQYGMHGIEADDNYLALMDSKGNYLINGDNSITMTRLDIKFGGVFMQYTGSNTAVERINATGTIKDDLIIQVLTAGHLYPPDIRYSYDISSTFRPPANVFIWNVYGQWSRCSCKGVRVRKILCMNSRTYDIEANSKCTHLEKPKPIEEKCRSECEFRWHIIDRTPCSVSCGHGFQKNVVVCLRLSDATYEEQPQSDVISANHSSIVANSECENDHRKPPFIQPCHLKLCPLVTHWEYTPWSTCSVSCGGGIRTRTATCKDEQNRSVGPHLCISTITVLSQICQTSPCPSWSTSEWASCSSPCGKGIRTRQVWCQQENQQVDIRFCPLQTRPATQENCDNLAVCNWNYGQWSGCSASCGHGYKTRSVYCVFQQILNSTIFNHRTTQQTAVSSYTVDDTKCGSFNKPTNIESCSTKCHHPSYPSSNNIPQIQTPATINQIQKLETHRATVFTLPPGYRNRINFQRNDQLQFTGTYSLSGSDDINSSINTIIPNIFWRIGSWTSCSRPCGNGTQERYVICHHENGTQAVDQKACELYVAKPKVIQECKVKSCGTWRVGSWQKCLASCGKGTKNRYVACFLYTSGQITDEKDCDQSQRPLSRVDCILRPCPRTTLDLPKIQNFDTNPKAFTLDYNHVSGRKYQTSTIPTNKLTLDSIKVRDNSNYAALIATLPYQSSNQDFIQRYAIRPQHYNTNNNYGREPYNNVNPDNIVTNSITNEISNPNNVVMVNPIQSPPSPYTWPRVNQYKDQTYAPNVQRLLKNSTRGIWRIGLWTSCSVDCGNGWKKRLVVCQTHLGQNTDDCDYTQKPTHMVECMEPSCYYWQTENLWSQCDATCGNSGYRQRYVRCVRRREGSHSSDNDCQGIIRPLNQTIRCRGPCHDDERKNRRRHNGSQNTGSLSHWTTAYLANNHFRPYIRQKKNGMGKNSLDKSDGNDIELGDVDNSTVPHLKIGSWSSCSVTCGVGFQKRHIKCFYGEDEVAPLKCRYLLSSKKLASIRYCQTDQQCRYYEWRKYNWTSHECKKDCAANMISGYQERHVDCVDLKKDVMPDLLCQHRKKPLTQRLCNESYRIVKSFNCFPDLYDFNLTHRDTVPNATVVNTTSSYPTKYSWHKGPWAKCTSNTCNTGLKFRRVWCSSDIAHQPIDHISNETTPLCNKRRPKSIKTCRINHMCKVQSCFELKTRANFTVDGTYDIMIRDKLKKIYCHAMNTSQPIEYITLPVGETINYSEFYDKRLIIPNVCPPFDRKIDNCRCIKSENNMSGFTFFFKVRLDLKNLRIIGDDYTFSHSSKGVRIPFGTAGDCFSLVNCPQGTFSIDLSNTGFMISNYSHWNKYGNRPSMEININKNSTKIDGRCGGYCGKCTVHDGKGLVIIPI